MLKISIRIIRQSITTKHKIAPHGTHQLYIIGRKKACSSKRFQHSRGLVHKQRRRLIIADLRAEIKALHTHINGIQNRNMTHEHRITVDELLPAHFAALAHSKPVLRRTDNLKKALTRGLRHHQSAQEVHHHGIFIKNMAHENIAFCVNIIIYRQHQRIFFIGENISADIHSLLRASLHIKENQLCLNQLIQNINGGIHLGSITADYITVMLQRRFIIFKQTIIKKKIIPEGL